MTAGAANDGGIVAIYDTNALEQLAFIEQVSRELFGARRTSWNYRVQLFVWFLLVGLFGSFVSFSGKLGLDFDFHSMVFGIGMFAVVILVSCLLISRRRRSHLISILSSSRRSSNVTVAADAAGVSWQTGSERYWHAYDSIDRVWQTNLGIILRSGSTGLFVPDRGFISGEVRKKFVDNLRKSLPGDVIDANLAA